MPTRLNIKITCDVESLKITHIAKDDLSYRRFLDIIVFLKNQCSGKPWAPESKIVMECEIDDSIFYHCVTDTESFDRLFPLVDFIKSQYFNKTYSDFNIHTPVFIQRGECAGKFGIIENVYHEFVERSDYDNTSLCLQVGEITIWTDAGNVIIADRLKVAQEKNGEFHGYPQEPPIEIKVSRRQTDNNDYHVHVVGHKEIWASGSSETLAIGDLLITHPEYFGIQISREIIEKLQLSQIKEAMPTVDQTEIDSIIDYQSGTILLPSVESGVVGTSAHADLIGRSVQLIPTGKEPKMEKPLLNKTLVIRNVINDSFALQFNDEALIWREQDGFTLLPKLPEPTVLKKETPQKSDQTVPEKHQETTPMSKINFRKDQYVKPKEGHVPSLAGIGKIKRVNMMSGDILVEFANGMDWVHGINYEVTERPEETR